MTAPVFVDTNVLVYRHDSSEPAKQSRANDWIAFLARRRLARISFQVLQELYATLTRKQDPGFNTQEAREIVLDLAVWQPIAINFDILERSWLVQQRYSISWWDSLIVAAAQSCECPVLLTEDLKHGQRFGAVQVISPFASTDLAPARVLERSTQ